MLSALRSSAFVRTPSVLCRGMAKKTKGRNPSTAAVKLTKAERNVGEVDEEAVLRPGFARYLVQKRCNRPRVWARCSLGAAECFCACCPSTRSAEYLVGEEAVKVQCATMR